LLSCKPTALDLRMLSGMGFKAVLDLAPLECALMKQHHSFSDDEAKLVEQSGLIYCRAPEAIMHHLARAPAISAQLLTDLVGHRLLAYIAVLVTRHGKLAAQKQIRSYLKVSSYSCRAILQPVCARAPMTWGLWVWRVLSASAG
jgi:hypothetical protein